MNAIAKPASLSFANLPHVDSEGGERAVLSALREYGAVGVVSNGQPLAVLLNPELYEAFVSMADAPSTRISETESGLPDERRFVASSVLLKRLRN